MNPVNGDRAYGPDSSQRAQGQGLDPLNPSETFIDLRVKLHAVMDPEVQLSTHIISMRMP